MRSDAGFSLIEMLVALTIMALAAGLVVLTNSSGASLAAETDRFAAAIAAARDQALIENRTVVMSISDTGYAASSRRRLGPPVASQTGALWEAGTSVASADGRLPVVLMFDPVGLTEPVELMLFRGSASERLSISSSGQVSRGVHAP